MKKNILLSWFAKNLYCENSAGFSKAAPETHKYRLSFMTYQKDCIWLLNKFRKNSYLEKCVQNSKKGWLYVTYDDRLSILGQRNSHTPLDIICSILARVHSNKSGKFCGTLSMISSNNRHTPRNLIMYYWINVLVKFKVFIYHDQK